MSANVLGPGAQLGMSRGAQAAREQRRHEVAAMMVGHATQKEMARLLGVNQSTISRDIAVIRRYWRVRAAQQFQTWIAEECGKLDELEKAFMPKARGGDYRAAEVLRGIRQDRARLFGLNAPEKLEVLTLDALDAEIGRLTAELNATDAEPLSRAAPSSPFAAD